MRKNSWGNEQFETCEISLIVRGNLDFDTICNTLTLNPNIIIKKGEVISKVVGESEEDVYIYSKKYNSVITIDDNINDFLTEIIIKKDELHNLSKQNNISLRIYLQSSQSQISFSIKTELLQKINELRVPIEFSIISWGEI